MICCFYGNKRPSLTVCGTSRGIYNEETLPRCYLTTLINENGEIFAEGLEEGVKINIHRDMHPITESYKHYRAEEKHKDIPAR